MTDPTPSTAPRTTDEQRGRRRALLLGGAGALAVAAIVTVLVVTGGGTTDPTADLREPAAASSSTPAEGATTEPGAEPDAEPDADAPTASSTVPADREEPPVGLDASPTVADGITLRVESLVAVDGAAALPGEVEGPGVSVTLVVDNAGDEPFDLSTTVVNVYAGEALTPGNALSTGTSALPTEVGAGDAVTATYVFTVPAEDRDEVRVTVDTAVDLPTIVFEGPAS